MAWCLSVRAPARSVPDMTDLLFLGIDGGGTKCRARLRNAEGRLLGEGTGGPSNIRLDPDLVWNSLSHRLSRSARPSGASRERSRADPCRHGSRRRRADLCGRAPAVARPPLRILRDRDGRPYRLARRLQRPRRGDPDRRHRLVRLWRYQRRLPLCRRLGL